jgi:hypothetical protein
VVSRPRGSGEVVECLQQVVDEHLLEFVEVGRARLDAVLVEDERAVVVDAEVERRADRQVGAGGAQHRRQGDLRRDGEVRLGMQQQHVEPELAVLRLADLQERSGVGGPDVVALRVDEEDLRAFTADLATEDERRGAVGS